MRLLALLGCFVFLTTAAVAEPNRAELERQLPSLTGLARARALADLTDACKSNAAEQAIRYGEEALTLFRSYSDPAAEVRTLNELGWAYMTVGKYPQAVAMVERGHALATKTNDRNGVARALNNLGVIARSRGEYGRAVNLFTASLREYRGLGDQRAVATALNNLGFVHGTDLSDYDRGLQFHLQALRLREQLGDSDGVALSLNNIGIIYGRLTDFDRAVQYLDRALELRRRAGAKNRIAATLSNLGDIELKRRAYELARKHHQEALAIRREIGEKSGTIVSLKTLADLDIEQGHLDRAAVQLDEARRLADQLGDRGLQANTLLSAAALARRRGEEAAAIDAAQRALAIGRETAAKDLILRSYTEIAAAQEAHGDYAAALASYKNLKTTSDALVGAERQKHINELEALYHKEQREAEIERLKREEATQALQVSRQRAQRNAAIGGVILALLLLAIGAGFYRRRVELASIAQKLSVTDVLTGLHNRRHLMQRFDEAAGATANRTFPETVVFILDIDHFKAVNDTFGHAAGDELLKQFADVLRATCAPADTIVRWGGEEFVVVAPMPREQAAERAERMRAAIAAAEFDVGNGQVIRCTCSIGFAAHPFSRTAPEVVGWSRLLQVADAALYSAKESGRNTWVGLRAAEGAEESALAAMTSVDLPRLLAAQVVHADTRASVAHDAADRA